MTGGFISTSGQLSINVATTAKQVSHWWTQMGGATPHPKTRKAQGYRYVLEIDFYTLGEAALRVGADRWIEAEGGRTFSCSTWNSTLRDNCQLYFSNWFTDTTNNQSMKTLRFNLDG